MGRLAGLRLGGMWVEATCVLPAYCKRTASVLQANCKRTAGVLPAYCQLAAENIHIVQNARRLHAATPAGAPKANAPPRSSSIVDTRGIMSYWSYSVPRTKKTRLTLLRISHLKKLSDHSRPRPAASLPRGPQLQPRSLRRYLLVWRLLARRLHLALLRGSDQRRDRLGVGP